MKLRLRRREPWPMCRDLMERVTDYLDGAMSASEVAAVEAHLAECPGCQAAIDQFRRTIEVAGHLRGAEFEALDPHVRDELIDIFRTTRG